MQGYFLSVWPQTWESIWMPIQAHGSELSPSQSELLADLDFSEEFSTYDEVWCALFTEVIKAVPQYGKPSMEQSREFMEVEGRYFEKDAIDLDEIANSSQLSLEHLQALTPSSFESEAKLVDFMESAYEIFLEFSDLLARRYHVLLEEFLRLHNLRYSVTYQCRIHPTLQGLFTELCIELNRISNTDDHHLALYTEFIEAFQEFKLDQSERRIKTCFQKQINLIEAISIAHPNVDAKTLGEACANIGTWPHRTIRNSMSNIYGFTCDYPGLRHAGNPDSKIRDLDMRDFISISLTLISFLPYLAHRDNWIDAYSGMWNE